MAKEEKQILFRYLKEQNLFKDFEKHMKWALQVYKECGVKDITINYLLDNVGCKEWFASFATCHFSIPYDETLEIRAFHEYYSKALVENNCNTSNIIT